MRLAYFSPLPPARSGISDYSRELLPHLAKLCDLTLFAEQPRQLPESLSQQFSVRPLESYHEERHRHDLALYQMGNSMHHAAIYPLALRYPGVTVLHDLVLHHFIGHRTHGQGDFGAFVREMGYALGAEGVEMAWGMRRGRHPNAVFDVPLNNRLIDRSLGLIAHSHYVAERISSWREDRPVAVVPALIGRSHATARGDLPWLAGKSLLFGSTGQVTPSKQVGLALRAFARLRDSLPDAAYVIVGEVHEQVALPALIQELELQDAVHRTGFVDELQEFLDWTATADVIVNLRHPTAGETSATALRALAAGRPLIVSDQGWYGELPDDVCLKVSPLDEDALVEAMRTLATNPELRQEMGARGQAYARSQHDPELVSRRYVAFLNNILEGTASAAPATHE